MINILSYVGMNMQSEVCLWCLLGLVRTIFDATLFKVNANLKQVWQMTMPAELSMPVQRVLRTMVSGIMLVQCFTVYVYLAAYIVLLYPVFLEERPTLVLPWLLLAAIRKLLCELTSLALGLGTCVLLGPARPPCIKFVVFKFTSIMPAFYMWMLVFSYYHTLKVASAFKTFPAVLPPNDNDYGLELAVRRRRTKSLLGEEQLRKKLVANFYGERTASVTHEKYLRPVIEITPTQSTDASNEETVPETDVIKPLTMSTTGWSDIGAYEDWFGSEVMIPRDTDRILEQIVLMLLRIGAYLKKEGIESIIDSQILNSAVPPTWHQRDNIDCTTINADDTDTPPLVGSSRGNTASYLREYPQIFMKKQSTDIPQTERTIASLKTVHSHIESEEGNTGKNKIIHPSSDTSMETIDFEIEKVPSKKVTVSNNKVKHEDTIDKLTMPKPLKSKQLANTEGKKTKTKRNKHLGLESRSKENVGEAFNKLKNSLEKIDILDGDDKKKSSNNKILNENNNNELSQNKISTSVKAVNNTDSKILKQNKHVHKEHELVQNKMPTDDIIQNSIDHKIVPQDNHIKNHTSQHSNNNKTLNEVKNEKPTHSKTLKQDSNKDIVENNISTSTKTQTSNTKKTLRINNNEESKDTKMLKQDNVNDTIKSSILTNALSQVSEDKKTLYGGNINETMTANNELPQNIISTDSKTNTSTVTKIIKRVSSNQSIQSEIPNNVLLNSGTLIEDNCESSTDNKLLKQDRNRYDFAQSEILGSTKTQKSTDSSRITQNAKIESITFTYPRSQHTTNTNIERIEESVDIKILKQDNNKDFTQSEPTTSALGQVSKDRETSNEENDKVSMDSTLKQVNSYESRQNSTQNSRDGKIMVHDNEKELIHSKTSIEAKIQNTAYSKITNEIKHNEFTNNNISNEKNIKDSEETVCQECKNYDFSQNVPHMDILNELTNNKIFSIDYKNKSTYSNLKIEVKNAELTSSKQLYRTENLESVDNKISANDNNTESLGTCSCSSLDELNGKEMGNNDTQTP